MSNDLKWASQTEKATNVAKGIIVKLKNSFSYFDVDLGRLLYVSLIRPHLENAVSVWNPHLKKDIDQLENIQQRATRLCPSNKKKTYEDRLKVMRLTTLVTRKTLESLLGWVE